jgi:hypothetical protein
MSAVKTLEAKTTFVVYDPKQKLERIVRPGDKLPANSPLVKGREQLFGPEKAT